jgi:hypothetical protein
MGCSGWEMLGNVHARWPAKLYHSAKKPRLVCGDLLVQPVQPGTRIVRTFLALE